MYKSRVGGGERTRAKIEAKLDLSAPHFDCEKVEELYPFFFLPKNEHESVLGVSSELELHRQRSRRLQSVFVQHYVALATETIARLCRRWEVIFTTNISKYKKTRTCLKNARKKLCCVVYYLRR